MGGSELNRAFVLQKIPVHVVAGAPGPAFNRVVSHLLSSAEHRWLVLGSAGVLAQLAQPVSVAALPEGDTQVGAGCSCCSVQGPVVQVLREHFLQALQGRVPKFQRVVCLQALSADPAGLIAALRYDAFLGERYSYEGCITLVQAFGHQQKAVDDLLLQPAVLLADVLAFNAADHAWDDRLAAVNPWAATLDTQALPPVPQLLERLAASAHLPRLRVGLFGVGPHKAGLFSGPSRQAASSVSQVAVQLQRAPTRLQLYAAVDAFLSDDTIEPIRLHGVIQLAPSNDWFELRATHRHRAPLQPLHAPPLAPADTATTQQTAWRKAGGFLCVFRAEDPVPAAKRLCHALETEPVVL